MIDIVLEVHWSNNPMPINDLIENPEFVFDLPLGFFTGLDAPVTSVQGKTGSVELDAEDVGAEPAGSVAQAIDELQPQFADINDDLSSIHLQIDSLSDNKLDKVDYIQHWRGVHGSYAELVAAIPIGNDGDYAHIEASQNFGRLSAIWSGIAGVWNISGINVGSNTDEMPEGNLNLYFKTDRVLSTLLAGFSPVNSVISAADTIAQGFSKAQGQISNIINTFAENVRNTLLSGIVFTDKTKVKATDSVEKAVGKLQAQLDDSPAAVTWYNAKTIGTIHRDIDNAWTNIEFAKINGMLWIRGRVYGAISPSIPWVTIANSSWYLNAPLTPTSGNSIPVSFLGVQQATGGPLIHHQFYGAQSTFYGLSFTITSSFTDKYVFINATCLGQLAV
ncbi:hypothetical protein [Acinetobacter dispersus]|uniref:hypothetical protein n=1 Tax=Acinetobacter dispersus TaxID=70348 RepID=UPI00132EE922|nr:hypothetical protein [Acinetobacter dispersus]QHH96677.1 hypothetical protein FPL17_03630 [Acinetobacter dispersus]